MTKEEFEQLKSTVKQWLFHTGSLDPTNYANELKLKSIEPKEKRITELEKENAELRKIAEFQQSSNVGRYFENKKLVKAKKIIKQLYSQVFQDMDFMELNDYNVLKAEAEQFLNSEVENDR